MDKASTGIRGLDDILHGGLERNRLYMVLGDPGLGKTTLALQFLLEGVRKGERCLYVTLSETEEEVQKVAGSHGWSLDGMTLYEFRVAELDAAGAAQTMFHPAEVDLEEATRPLFREVERLRPDRVVVDSLADIRLLAREDWHFRRHLLTLKRRFAQHGTTALLLDDAPLHHGVGLPLVHGAIHLQLETPEYGRPRRRLSVLKLRGTSYREGLHDYQISTGGLVVYPRLVAAEHLSHPESERMGSGLVELDQLLGGGLDSGSSLLLMGASGVGKSSLATLYALHAAREGRKAALFLFEENRRSFLDRARSLGMDLQQHLETGMLLLQQIDPAEMSPGEFSNLVKHAVERDGARLLLIDSLNGYLNSVPGERFLLLHLHELLTYLGHQGVTTLLCLVQHGTLGPAIHAEVDVSYLSDSILLLRYFEQAGEIRKVISVVKKRSGSHERTLRELVMSAEGIRLGEPLRGLQGVLTGQPVESPASSAPPGGSQT